MKVTTLYCSDNITYEKQSLYLSSEGNDFNLFFIRCTFFLYGLDIDTFISDTLKGENLSKKAKEKKEALLKKLKDVKAK